MQNKQKSNPTALIPDFMMFFLKDNCMGVPHSEMVSHPGFELWVGAPQPVAFTTPTVSPLTDFMMLIDDPNSLQRGWLTSDEA
jgi:hypothetical protein